MVTKINIDAFRKAGIKKVFNEEGKLEWEESMKETGYTPTPWHVTAKGYNHYIQKNYDGTNEFTVAICSGNQTMAKANSAFIVRAVNSHEKMLSALKQLRDVFKEGSSTVEMIDEAIVQAEGE